MQVLFSRKIVNKLVKAVLRIHVGEALSGLHRNRFTGPDLLERRTAQSMNAGSRVKISVGLVAFLFLSPGTARTQQYGSSAEFHLLNAANQERKANGLAPLQWDEKLAAAARSHAREMAKRNASSHEFPGEDSLPVRVTKAGVQFSAIAENVADAPSVARIHDLWMHSPGHRANILDKEMDSLGVGVVERNGQYFAVEDFAKK
jgi:uncharacterized protein YkwD